MAAVLREGYLCVDCTVWCANGDDSGIDDPERAREVREARPEYGHDWTPSCPEDCEGEFRRGPCDRCGSPLAGDFHPAVILG